MNLKRVFLHTKMMTMMNTRGKSVLKKPKLDSIFSDVAPSMSRKDFVKSSVRKIAQRHFSFQLAASLYGKCLQMLNEYNRNSRDRGRQNTTEKHIKQNSTNSFFFFFIETYLSFFICSSILEISLFFSVNSISSFVEVFVRAIRIAFLLLSLIFFVLNR